MGPAGFLNVLNVLRYCDKCEKLFFFVFFFGKFMRERKNLGHKAKACTANAKLASQAKQ